MLDNTRKLDVLIIEDNLGDFVIIEDYLKEEIPTVNVQHAKTFKVARKIIEASTRFDIILLDLTLPDGSGEELVNDALLAAGTTPLIVLTGYSNKDFGIKTLALGVADYILKDGLDPALLYKSISYSIERKKITNELKRSEQKYRDLFNSSPIPMWVYDPKTYLFLNVNAAACRHYGFSREEFLSMSIMQIRSKKDVKKIEQIIASHKDREDYYEGVFEHIKKNTDHIYVNIQSNAIQFSEKSARLVVANDITEKIKAETTLKLSEQRFKSLVQEGSDLICILDVDGNYKYVSPTSGSILGISPEEFINANAFSFIHEDDKKRVQDEFKLLSSEKRIHLTPYRFRSFDGTYRWIESIVTNMIDDPSINGMVANSRDVSDRYTYEAKLRKQEALFRAIIEKGSEMKTLITPEGKIIFGTPSITRILGYTEDEYLGMNEYQLVHPEDVESLVNNIKLCLAGEQLFGNIQLRIKAKSGEYRWCEKTITNLLDDPDVNAIVCNFRDITNKKKADLLIKESNDRYNLVSKATSDAIWDHSFLYNTTYIAGNGFKQLFGYDIVNDYTESFFWEERLHPEDKSRMLKELNDFINDLTQTQSQFEYRFRKVDGTYSYVNDRLFIIRENEIPVRIIGAINDITHKKEEEHRLKLLESIITNANDAVMITEVEPIDAPGPRIIYVNEALANMTGYSKEEILGKSPRLFQGPRSDRTELDKMKNALQKQEHCTSEVINYAKNGRPYWVEIGIAPVTDNSGKVSHMIAIERDITSRKVQEQEREKLIFELLQNNKDLRQFSYITSHNLRGPIANLLGLTNLLDNFKVQDATLSKIMDGIKKAATNFDETIKDLATVLNVKDRPSIPKEEILFTTLHEKIIEQYRLLIEESKATIEVDFSKAPSVNFNKAYLESIFSNLFTNAVKYRSKYVPLTISVSSEDDEQETILKFKDNGRGIDLKLHKEKIFGLYQRFHQNTEGKGLGLFLIKSQMEALNGSIDVESESDQGTTFVLRFKKLIQPRVETI